MWVKVDRLFAPVSRLVRVLLEPFITNARNNSGKVVVMKFFGMGSIIRMLSLCEERGIDFSRVILVTFEGNEELCRLWGVRGILVRNNSLGGLISSSLSAIHQVAKLKPQRLIDFERSSNLTSIFRTIAAWRANCPSVGFEMKSRESGTIKIHAIEGMSQQDIFDEGLRTMPVKEAERNRSWVEVKPGKLIVNINTSNLLPARRLDLNSFAEVIDRLSTARKDLIVFLSGTIEERDYVEQLASRFDDRIVINVAGKWTLTRFITELTDCELLITGDSAPLHLAASMNVPTLALWGPTQPGHFGYRPTSTLHHLSMELPCSPCFLHPRSRPAVACNGAITCMRELSPALIEEKALEVMRTTPPSREIIFPSKHVPLAANVLA